MNGAPLSRSMRCALPSMLPPVSAGHRDAGSVLIDEFQRLAGITIEGNPDPKLVSLFEEPMASGKTPHLISGNAPEIQEMAVAQGLKGYPSSRWEPRAPRRGLARSFLCMGPKAPYPIFSCANLGGILLPGVHCTDGMCEEGP